jgi:hypothetical protein
MAWSYWMAARMALKLAPEAEQRTTAIVNLHFQVSVHLDSARNFHCLASLLQMQRQIVRFFSHFLLICFASFTQNAAVVRSHRLATLL